MQYTHTKNTDKALQRDLLFKIAKVLCFVASLVFVWYTLSQKEILYVEGFWQQLWDGFSSTHLFIVIVLLPLNWGLEAFKWKYLATRLEKITFWQAFMGVLTGVSFGFVTPQGFGDYAGRVLQLNVKDRAKGIGAVFVTRIGQLYITIIAGSASVVYLLFSHYFSTEWMLNYTFLVFILFANVMLVVFFLYYRILFSILKKIKFLYPYFSIIRTISKKQMLVVLAVSALRYFVFSLQYVVLLYFAHIDASILTLFIGVSFVFLVKSSLPTFFDVGVREAAAVYFFGPLVSNVEVIVFASLTIWLINIVVPSLIGLLFIFRIKLMPKV